MSETKKPTEKDQDLRVEVELLKRDISTFDRYFQKIDNTLEKVGEATIQVVRIVTLHEERLEQQAAHSNEIKLLIEERRRETEKLSEKLDEQGEKFAKSLDSLKKELVNEIGSHKTLSDRRIKKLEIWRWIVIGGALVISFFVSQFVKSYFDQYWSAKVPTHIEQPLK